MLASLGKGFDLIRRDSRIAALGMGQSCFEGAMYTFVFMWTPALKSDAEKLVESRTPDGSEAPILSVILSVDICIICFLLSINSGRSCGSHRDHFAVPGFDLRCVYGVCDGGVVILQAAVRN